MPRLRFGIVRYPDVLRALEQELAPAGGLTCQLGAGRVRLVWRGIGATRWDATAQLARALELAAGVRTQLAADPRQAVRTRARHAVVVRFEDVAAADGCTVRAVWECIIPSPLAGESLQQTKPRHAPSASKASGGDSAAEL